MQKVKWSLLVLVVLVIAIGVLGYNVYKTPKVAYIDSAKLMENSKDMQLLRKKVDVEREKAKARLDTLTIEFEESLKAHEKKSVSMTANEKRLSSELLRTKQGQLVQYQQAISQKLDQEQQRETEAVLKKINGKISEYGQKYGYTMILATSNGNIAYADKQVDITDEIITELGSSSR